MTSAETLAAAEVERLRSLAPPISGVGIGGSLGRGDADNNSDVDIFVFFDTGDPFLHARWLLNQLKTDLETISTGPLKFFAGYGVCLSFVLAGPRKLEYFINTPTSWTANPMRANTNIRFDLTGCYTAAVNACNEQLQPVETEAAMSDVLHDLLLEGLNLLKYAQRKDVWSMHYRVAAVRRELVAIHIGGSSARPFDVQTAMAHADELTDEHADTLARTAPANDELGMAGALRALTTLSRSASVTAPLAGDPRWQHLIVALTQAEAALLQ
jgi:predicted nucleotidyltransferase